MQKLSVFSCVCVCETVLFIHEVSKILQCSVSIWLWLDCH